MQTLPQSPGSYRRDTTQTRLVWFGVLLIWIVVGLCSSHAQAGIAGGTPVDVLMLDSHATSGFPSAASIVPLGADIDYVLVVEGTFSAWSSSEWSPYPCAGETEDGPQFPSEATVDTGPTGLDARFVFAWPFSSPSLCPSGLPEQEPPVGPTELFQISLDGGDTWFSPDPMDLVYNEDHVYQYLVMGLGYPLQARLNTIDQASDDYGQLRITIRGLVLEVSIDIKPGDDPNTINCLHNGVIPVAILTTSLATGDPTDFDATTVKSFTVAFGPGAATPIHSRAHISDVDGDGDLDMLLHFRQGSTGLQCGDEEACLVGETDDGTPIHGCDSVRIVP